MGHDDREVRAPFQLLIKPVAADCNMACSYCFYRHKNALFDAGPHRMSYDMLEHIISDYMGYGFDPAVFIWQGGEPTMAGLEFFKKVVEFEQAYGHRGQRVGNALQTNGLLIDDAWADFLFEYKFLVGASIDGPPEIHDLCRRTPAGNGTFDRVMASVDMLRKREVAVNILSVVSQANVERGEEVYRFFRREGFTDLQFIPCLERDSTGGPADFNPTPRQFGRFLCDVFDAWLQDGFPEVTLRTFESLIACAAGMNHTLCTFSPRCGSYFLIEHNGDVFPCDFFMEPRWKVGNVSEAPLADFFKSGREMEFLRQKPNPDAGCIKCRWWKFCHAGCVKDWMDSKGKPAKKTYFCESYKMFLSHSEHELNRIGMLVSGKKPGRNDPCPCGSGKKYKKCCMIKNNDEI